MIVILSIFCLLLVFKPFERKDKNQNESVNGISQSQLQNEYNKWITDEKGRRYINKDGKECKNEIVEINGAFYKFDENGYSVTGWSKDNNETRYFLDSGEMATGWQYISDYKYYFDSEGKMVTDLRDKVEGPYLIKVNRSQNCVTVYAKDGDKGYIIPVTAFLCSTGGDITPLGTFTMQTKYRWRQLFGAHGQYCSRITGYILFHSIPYTKSGDIYSMEEGEYNKLGTSASAGCVRLQLIDSKWIYDNCETGKTTVIIYDDSNPGPFGKPTVEKIPDDQQWDPTDPEVKKN